MQTYFKELELAKKLAKNVGAFLGEQDSKQIENSKGRDIKLLLDREAEHIIIEKLKSATSYSILSEESGLVSEIIKDEPYWIVDPIDGTLNYSRNCPISCVSIALWKNSTPLLGVVYDFNRNELFSGLVGAGSWLNDKELFRQPSINKSQAILATGFPTYLSTTNEYLKSFFDKINSYKKIRILGSAALSLCYVSCGRVDAYYESKIKLWDVAAGIAINKAIRNEIKITILDNFETVTEVGI